MHGPWFLYLDESGDLGFDTAKPGRSHHFTICILAIRNVPNNGTVARAIQKTIKGKLNPKGKRKRIVDEIKGSATSIQVKRYFFRQVTGVHFGVYALTLNKACVYPYLQESKDLVYSYLARLILDQVPFESADTFVHLSIDKSKSKPKTREFNRYIEKELRTRLAPHIPLRITHEDSKANP
jgi:hypothetical protein